MVSRKVLNFLMRGTDTLQRQLELQRFKQGWSSCVTAKNAKLFWSHFIWEQVKLEGN